MTSIVARFQLQVPPRTAPEPRTTPLQQTHSRRTADGLSCAPSPCSCQVANTEHPRVIQPEQTHRKQPATSCSLLAASPLLAVAAAHCRRCIGRLELPSCDMHSPAPQSHVAPPAMLWHGLRFLSRYEPQQPKRAMFCSSAECAETSTELVTHCTHFVILTQRICREACFIVALIYV